MNDKKNNPWKEWELLAYEYVKNIIKDSEIHAEKHTADSHDLGFDGIWLIRSDDRALMKLVLMEAKYRTSQSSLPLNDCAKAIIIAFNLSASQLYIVTNIPFAPQTKENVIKFQKSINLEITCVNGNDLKKFICQNKARLRKHCKISEEFLTNLTQNIVVDQSPVLFSQTPPLAPDYICVPARQTQITQISDGLILQKSIYIISGKAGSGKSVFCDKIRELLTQKNFDSRIIDLSLCVNSRVLYLTILENIWGVKLESILEDTDLENYIDKLLAVNNFNIDSQIIKAVRHILLSNYSNYQKHKDVYIHLLLKYLDAILKSKQHFLRIALFFENLHTISEETYIFLIDIIQNLRKNNIRIVMEIRTPFLMPKLNDIPKSRTYFQYIKKISDSEFEIAPFQRSDSIKLIEQHFKFTEHVSNSLADILCDNPLEMHNAIKMLEYQYPHLEKQVNLLPYNELKMYWTEQGITFNATTMSLLNNLKTFRYFCDIFELSVILKGNISSEILYLFFPNTYNEIIQACVESTIFDFKKDTLVCKHLRYLDAMKEISDQTHCYQIAKKLLPYVSEHKETDERYSLIELDILYILEDFEKILDKMLHITYCLMEMHQYNDALRELLKYIQTLQNNTMSLSLQVLFRALNCIRELHEENNEKYTFIYELTEEIILLEYTNFEETKFWYKYQLMLWHRNFVMGNLRKAFSISESLYNSLEIVSPLFEFKEDYPGQVYNAYGLSTKMCNSGRNAYDIFKEGAQRYPSSYYVRAALLSQEGNQLLKCNPDAAAEKYKELIKTVNGELYPYQEVLHTKIDIAMSFFLAGKFRQSQIWVKKAIEESSTLNMYFQKGRAENIYGCCLAAQADYNNSMEKFQNSIYLLEMSKSQLYLWRAQLNLASVLFFRNPGDEKVKPLLHKVLHTFKEIFMEKIKKDRQSVPYSALLLILRYLYDLKEYETIIKAKKDFFSADLGTDFSRLLIQKDWKNQFKTKVICYSEIVLVTG